MGLSGPDRIPSQHYASMLLSGPSMVAPRPLTTNALIADSARLADSSFAPRYVTVPGL